MFSYVFHCLIISTTHILYFNIWWSFHKLLGFFERSQGALRQTPFLTTQLLQYSIIPILHSNLPHQPCCKFFAHNLQQIFHLRAQCAFIRRFIHRYTASHNRTKTFVILRRCTSLQSYPQTHAPWPLLAAGLFCPVPGTLRESFP